MRIAVIGSGISGLTAAHRLSPDHAVTVYEAGDRLGGHVNTVEVDLAGRTHAVDVGFVVFNLGTYPRFVRLIDELGVAAQDSEMSFSVSVGPDGLEYGGTGIGGVFAQPGNALRPSFYRLLWDVTRFNRLAKQLALGPDDSRTVAEFLRDERFGSAFVDHFLLPLGAAVWSVDPERFAATPVRPLAVFLERHDFLRVRGRPVWKTVVGGASSYVRALVAHDGFETRTNTPVIRLERGDDLVRVVTASGHHEDFDRVVLAVPSDRALAMLDQPTSLEREVLGAFGWTTNTVTLHCDERMMPRRRRAWAAWNYLVPSGPAEVPTVTYWMNRLQRFDSERPVLVTLNRHDDIDPTLVFGSWEMRHPVIDAAALAAQTRFGELNARGPVHFCGAYWGSGFHEDGMASADSACDALTAGAAEVVG